MRNYLKLHWFKLLVTLGLKKPFKTYKGKPVTEFPHDFDSFLSQYIQILYKSSKLTASRRRFVVREVEKWLDENNIAVSVFKNQILS